MDLRKCWSLCLLVGLTIELEVTLLCSPAVLGWRIFSVTQCKTLGTAFDWECGTHPHSHPHPHPYSPAHPAPPSTVLVVQVLQRGGASCWMAGLRADTGGYVFERHFSNWATNVILQPFICSEIPPAIQNVIFPFYQSLGLFQQLNLMYFSQKT